MPLFGRLMFSIPVFSVTPVLTRTNRVLEVARIFTKHSKCWQIFRADNVFVRFYGLFRYFTSSYYSTRCWIFHCTIRFINQISKEVPYETLSIPYHFYKIVHENTFALTLPCFIWASRAIAKHARVVLSVFCQCSSFVVNGITEI